jgi:hypothetical protein
MNHLTKNSTCPCGNVKVINWIEPEEFINADVLSCVGFSECDCCSLIQTHYAGDPEGAISFQKAMQEIEKENNPINKH